MADRAARWALTEAGMADIDWIAAGLAALEAGRGMPAPFDDDAAAWRLLEADDRIPNTTVRSPDGATDNWSQQHCTMPALPFAAHRDPLRAAVASVAHAVVGVGPDRRDVLLAAFHDGLDRRG